MKRPGLWVALSGLCLLACLCFAIPMYVIRPFRAQGAGELALALSVRGWGPWLAIACAMASLGLAVLAWRRTHRAWSRAAVVAAALFTACFAVLTHVNVYELMFHPIPSVGFITADQAKVDADDMVMTVTVAGLSRAYPIRTMGYHHIANDWVGGEPIVATY